MRRGVQAFEDKGASWDNRYDYVDVGRCIQVSWAASDDALATVSHLFAVAMAVMVASVGALMTTTTNLGRDTASTDAADAESSSRGLLDTLLASDWSWQEDDMAVQRLQAPDGSIDLASLIAMRGGGDDAQDNGRIDYEELRQVLGVPAGRSFHLRVTPADLEGTAPDLSGIRTAYIADWQHLASVTVDLGTDEQMLAEARVAVDTSMDSRTLAEREHLVSIGVDFDDDAHLTMAVPQLLVDTGHITVPMISRLGDLTLLEGDVYYDDPAYLKNAFPSRIGQYDAIVIGNGVAPAALNDGSILDQLAKHVRQGGLLAALGGTEDTAWVESLVELLEMQPTVNQEVTNPDVAHPILRWPEPVDHAALGEGPVYAHAAFDDDEWQHVLTDGENATLLVSQAGSPGDGIVVLSSLRPGDGPAGEALLRNIFSYYARQDAHLDYGETMPAGMAVGAASRLVYGVDAGDNPIPLRFALRYW